VKGVGLTAGLATCGIAALAGAFYGQPIIFALALFMMVVIMIIAGNRVTRENRAESYQDDLNPEARTLLRPIRKLHQELAQFVSSTDRTEVKVIGTEALSESRAIVQHCANLLQLRTEIKRSLQGRYTAEKDIGELNESIQSAQTESEKQSLETALQARQKELGHYVQQEEALSSIEGQLRQAEAALAELKARLMVSASSSEEVSNPDELTSALSRLKSLSGSLDEAEELLRGGTR
jgi:hypothetical protein